MCHVLSRFSRVQLFVTLRPVAHQTPLSTGLSKQEPWSGLSFPSPGAFLTQGLNPRLPRGACQAAMPPSTWAGGVLPPAPPGKPLICYKLGQQ